MNYQFIGEAAQALLVNLSPGESVRAEVAAMLFCNEAIRFEARPADGLLGGLKRVAGAMTGGENFFVTHFECLAPGGVVAFGAPHAGKLHALELGGKSWLCARESFLCATSGVKLETSFARKFGAGLFGGEGFSLQKATGDGTVFLHIGGNLVESDLQAGQTLRVDPGCIVAIEPSIGFDIQAVGGFKNYVFGGEGIHLAHLKGPGKALLQTLPMSRLAGRALQIGDVFHAARPGASGLPNAATSPGGIDIGRIFSE